MDEALGRPEQARGIINPMKPDDEELWAAVTEPGRRLLLDALLAQGEATPTALASELPFTRQAVTKHLTVLERAGLVEAHKQGREVHYKIRPDRLNAATEAMARLASKWDARLKAIKQLAEQTHQEEQNKGREGD